MYWVLPGILLKTVVPYPPAPFPKEGRKAEIWMFREALLP